MEDVVWKDYLYGYYYERQTHFKVEKKKKKKVRVHPSWDIQARPLDMTPLPMIFLSFWVIGWWL